MRQLVRQHLPARAQDVARSALDALDPKRRANTRAQGSHRDGLAERVAPEGYVLAGPFAGMWMRSAGSWGGNAARLAGSYEEELTPWLSMLLAAQPSLVIDAGAAEGYYAVGLARALPSTPVIAYDIEPAARRICREAAARNGVSNLKVRGRITPAELQKRLRPGALVLSDLEGYEYDLMNPERAPTLRRCALLIELHEFAAPGVTGAVTGRFAGTHDIALVDAVARSAGGRSQLSHLTPDDAHAAVQEGRPQDPPMQWAVMTPLA